MENSETSKSLIFFILMQSSTAQMDVWRSKMTTAVKELESEYNTLMFGGLAITQTTGKFDKPVPASAFLLPSFSDMFFKSTNCMRYGVWGGGRCIQIWKLGRDGTFPILFLLLSIGLIKAPAMMRTAPGMR